MSFDKQSRAPGTMQVAMSCGNPTELCNKAVFILLTEQLRMSQNAMSGWVQVHAMIFIEIIS